MQTFFVAALGAKKGLIWLSRNRNPIPMRVRAHLGATINFQAGAIKSEHRLVLRKIGLEWLWRILEEPYLWRRYWLGWLRIFASNCLSGSAAWSHRELGCLEDNES
jgi:UDP-N-acetyl-D-mannosaminuronic acid transferase (WecB/TagA/CpsF family)